MTFLRNVATVAIGVVLALVFFTLAVVPILRAIVR